MALEDLTGTDKFVTSLNASWPVDDDWVDEGDNHIRGVKNVLKNTFPDTNGAVHWSSSWARFPDGTQAAPGVSWVNDTTSGLRRVSAGVFAFVTAGADTVRFTASRTFKAFTSGAPSFPDAQHELSGHVDGGEVVQIRNTSGGGNGLGIHMPNMADAAGSNFLTCVNSNGGRMLVFCNSGIYNNAAANVSWSDATIKRNIVPSPDYTSFVAKLQYRNFSYADDPTYTTDDVIAQELGQVDEGLVTLADGKLGVYSHRLQQRINSVIPKLIERIEALEAKVGV